MRIPPRRAFLLVRVFPAAFRRLAFPVGSFELGRPRVALRLLYADGDRARDVARGAPMPVGVSFETHWVGDAITELTGVATAPDITVAGGHQPR
jgi:hypothetical protein